MEQVKQIDMIGDVKAEKEEMGPIPLPVDALAEIIRFIPQAQRAPLVLANSQLADTVLSVTTTQRREVSPCTTPPTLPLPLSMTVPTFSS